MLEACQVRLKLLADIQVLRASVRMGVGVGTRRQDGISWGGGVCGVEGRRVEGRMGMEGGPNFLPGFHEQAVARLGVLDGEEVGHGEASGFFGVDQIPDAHVRGRSEGVVESDAGLAPAGKTFRLWDERARVIPEEEAHVVPAEGGGGGREGGRAVVDLAVRARAEGVAVGRAPQGVGGVEELADMIVSMPLVVHQAGGPESGPPTLPPALPPALPVQP